MIYGNLKYLLVIIHTIRAGRFGSKLDQIGRKLDKSGAFSDQISVHLALPGFVPFGANLTQFGAKPTIPGLLCLTCQSLP